MYLNSVIYKQNTIKTKYEMLKIYKDIPSIYSFDIAYLIYKINKQEDNEKMIQTIVSELLQDIITKIEYPKPKITRSNSFECIEHSEIPKKRKLISRILKKAKSWVT
jgi:hypothetical protein